MEGLYGPETREEWLTRLRAARAELRARLRAADPQPDHWLKRANRVLQARLDAVAEEYGLQPAASLVEAVSEAAERVQEPPAPSRQPARAAGGVALD